MGSLLVMFGIYFLILRFMKRVGPHKMLKEDELMSRTTYYVQQHHNRKNTTGYKVGSFIGSIVK